MRQILLFLTFFTFFNVISWAQPSSCTSANTNENALNGGMGFGQSVTMTGCTFNNLFHSFSWTNRGTTRDYTTGTLTIYNGESTNGANQIYTQSITGLDPTMNSVNTIILNGGVGTLAYTVSNQYTFRIHNLNGTGTHTVRRAASNVYSGGRWLAGTTFTSSGFDIVFDVQTTVNALPVELTQLSGKTKEKQVIIDWQTASETKNLGFEIEWSADSRLWQKIGFVGGAGDSFQKQIYQFTHEQPVLGINYYRLKQMDFDGAYDYSKIVSVNIKKEGNIAVYPNPSTSKFNISGIDIQNAEISIYNTVGQLVKEGILTQPVLDISDLVDGFYYLTIMQGNVMYEVKVVKE